MNLLLTWSAATGSNPIATYALQRAFGEGSYSTLTTIAAAAPREYTDVISLGTPGTYHYRIIVTDSKGNTAISNICDYTIEEPVLPTLIDMVGRQTTQAIAEGTIVAAAAFTFGDAGDFILTGSAGEFPYQLEWGESEESLADCYPSWHGQTDHTPAIWLDPSGDPSLWEFRVTFINRVTLGNFTESWPTEGEWFTAANQTIEASLEVDSADNHYDATFQIEIRNRLTGVIVATTTLDLQIRGEDAPVENGSLIAHSTAVLLRRSQSGVGVQRDADGNWSADSIAFPEVNGAEPGTLMLVHVSRSNTGEEEDDFVVRIRGFDQTSTITTEDITLTPGQRTVFGTTQWLSVLSVTMVSGGNGDAAYAVGGSYVAQESVGDTYDIEWRGAIAIDMQATVAPLSQKFPFGPLTDPNTGVATLPSPGTMIIDRVSNPAARTFLIEDSTDPGHVEGLDLEDDTVEGVEPFDSVRIYVTAGTSSAPFVAIGVRYAGAWPPSL